MIGRGTRLWRDPITNERKNDFLIIDHWSNFQYFDINPEGEVSYPGEPLQARLFRLRLQRLAHLQARGDEGLLAETEISIKTMLLHLSKSDNFQVNEHKSYLRNLALGDEQPAKQDFANDGKLNRTIAPLMRFLPGVNAHILRFEIHTEELMLALLEDQPDRIPRLQEQIIDELRRLPSEAPEVQAKEELLTGAQRPEFWTNLDLPRILNLQKEIAPLMRLRLAEPRNLIKLRLPDQMQARRWITYGPGNEGAFVDQYRAQVEAHVKSLSEQEPTLGKLKRQQQLTTGEFTALTELLNKPDLFIREEILQQVYEHPEMHLIDFILSILENSTDQLPTLAQIIEENVQQFLHKHLLFTQAQRQFIYTLRSFLIQQARAGTPIPITLERLTQVPFNRVGHPKNLFNSQELDELLQFANAQISQIVKDDQRKDQMQA
jgi:type I restriction enzyme, R subunit